MKYSFIRIFSQTTGCKIIIDGISNGIKYSSMYNRNRVEIPANRLKHLSNLSAYNILTILRKQVVDTISEFYEEPNPVWNEFTLLSNLYGGDYHALHADNEKIDINGKWIRNHTPHRIYSAILYLNTSGNDFHGGHINFLEIRQEIVPKEGLLIGFPSNHNFLHETTPVTQSNRFSISLWMTSNKEHIEKWKDLL